MKSFALAFLTFSLLAGCQMAADPTSVDDSTDVDDSTAGRDPASPLDCDPGDCTGPTLDVNNEECADGSIGGPVCAVQDDGQCGWEVRQCPAPTECKPTDCEGPGLKAPNILCSDGSIAGPVCAPLDGACQWQIVECPEPEFCEKDKCPAPAPALPSVECADGSQGGPACLSNNDGTCGWAILECPSLGTGDAGACLPTDCHEEHPTYVLLCPDGSEAGFECQRDENGTCNWVAPECGPGSTM